MVLKMSVVIHSTKFALLILVLLPSGNNQQVGCFPLNYSSFPVSVSDDFIKTPESSIVYGTLQITQDPQGDSITHFSGRIVHKKRFKLWSRGRIASFNSTFVLNITPEPDGGGEGLAFIMSAVPEAPTNSAGMWLGIASKDTNGSPHNNIVAIEFDTKKSFPQDVDDNHIGLDINSVHSVKQVSLNVSDIRIASGTDITAMIRYDGRAKMMNVSVFKGEKIGLHSATPVISVPLDLSLYLPNKVFMGFSASTGSGSERNCIRSWYFTGDEIDLGMPLWIQVMVSLSIVLFLSFLFGGYMYWRKKQAKRGHLSSVDDPTIQGIETGLGPKRIKLKDLKAATGNFDAKNELGRGGFGIVYHGTWEGNEVAVKRTTNTPQGKQNLIAEVTTIGSLHHKNLVKLVGWCYEKNELLLAYEYMPNGSLDKLIYTVDEKQAGKEKLPLILTWERRHNIIRGVAQALDYLHTECLNRVLHRDIKASNIMLDSELNARLGDFGLARMFKPSEKTHHSTKQIAGTPGYMAPEIFLTGRATRETDVFAFGVLTLVVACGRKLGPPIDQGNKYMNSIIDWVWELYKSGMLTDAIDHKLKENFDKRQAECMLMLGLSCCHPNPYIRPSMRTILQVLMEEAPPPSVPSEKPAFIWPATPPSFTQYEFVSGGLLTTSCTLSGR